jgi:hypothetical protein
MDKKEYVKNRYRVAECLPIGDKFYIEFAEWEHEITAVIGEGKTETEAWEDAYQRMKEIGQ